MTSIQPILPIHNHIITDIVDFWSTSAIRLDVDIFECPVETGIGFTAINLDDTFTIGVSGKVLEMNVGPFECSCVWV